MPSSHYGLAETPELASRARPNAQLVRVFSDSTRFSAFVPGR